MVTARRRGRGTRWRRLTADRQPWPTCPASTRTLAVGFGIGLATVYQYIAEADEVLAALAPTLEQARSGAANKAFAILDGTLLSIVRIAADRSYHSGKRERHGMNIQVIADAFGLLWASPALLGAIHDVKAARTHDIIEAPIQADIRTWADKGIRQPRAIRVPYGGRWSTLPAGKRAVNSSRARLRAVGKQANATLKSWRLLRKLRCSTARITDIVKAVLSLRLAMSV
ncbi:transposase family protein [Streptomyces goshikiensis]|uniref:transposase family protein n=1 Tax=Streptomyces goshikiensis TaxID=1942 RepID=UPI00367B775C